MYICICLCMYICMYICVCIYVCNTYVYACMYMGIYMCVYKTFCFFKLTIVFLWDKKFTFNKCYVIHNIVFSLSIGVLSSVSWLFMIIRECAMQNECTFALMRSYIMRMSSQNHLKLIMLWFWINFLILFIWKLLTGFIVFFPVTLIHWPTCLETVIYWRLLLWLLSFIFSILSSHRLSCVAYGSSETTWVNPKQFTI